MALVMGLTGVLLGWSLGSGLSRSRPGRLPWWRRTEVWIGQYLLVRLLSTATSVAPHWSVWGDPAWRNGVWLTAAGGVLFVLARRTLSRPADRRRAVTAILVASGIVSAYGVAQYAISNWVLGQPLPRVSSTLAHANLLAAYLAMVVPLGAACLIAGPRRFWHALLLALQGACMILTYSRSGWLAAMAGLSLLGVAVLRRAGRPRGAGFLVAAGAAVVTVLLLLSLLPPLPGDAPHALQNLTNMFRWKGATARIRLLAWDATLEAIGERPWLGHGPATFGAVIEWFLPAELAPFGGANALGGRPHNAFLEVAVESGLLGLVSYLAMLGGIACSVARSAFGARVEQSLFRSAVLGSLAANLVTQLFSFDGAATTVLFWALAGMADARPDGSQQTSARTGRARRWSGRGVALVSVLLAAWLVAVDVLAFLGESVLAPRDFWRESTAALGLACDLSPTPEVVLAVRGRVFASWAEAQPDTGLWRRGADVYDSLARRAPDVAGNHRSRAWFLRRYHSATGDPRVAEKAIDSFSMAIRLSPHDPNLWIDRGLMWIDAGNPDEALDDLERANELLGGYARYYGAMSIYALSQGDAEAAAAWQERALEAQREWNAWVWRR
jgi:O-antigen ligase